MNHLGEKLLRLEALLLNNNPRLVTSAAMREMASLGISDEMAYAMILAGTFGLRPDEDDDDRKLVYEYLLPSLHKLAVSDYTDNPYYSSIVFPEIEERGVRLTYGEYAPFEAFPCGDMHREGARLLAPLGFFDQRFRYPMITQDGREWMTVTPNEIATMSGPIAESHGHVLVYGLGLGYYAYMVAIKPEVESVTVVERDEVIYDLFCKHILPQFPNGKVSLVLQDAFLHAETSRFLRYGRPFDMVFTDLWHDVGDGLPLYRKMKALQERYSVKGQIFRYWIEPSMSCY
ncbi:MAG: hypothetical protein J6Y98_09690 [Bacteroidales bacterium]|nr:hypothetical protein [Bacteroidales bacterium]